MAAGTADDAGYEGRLSLLKRSTHKHLGLLVVLLILGACVYKDFSAEGDLPVHSYWSSWKGYLRPSGGLANLSTAVTNSGGPAETQTLGASAKQAEPWAAKPLNGTDGDAESGLTASVKSRCQLEDFHTIVPGLNVEGPCSCLAGQECTLRIFSSDPSLWDTKDRMLRETIMYFEGPTRERAKLEVDHFAYNTTAAWRARYLIWDAGTYRAVVFAGCGPVRPVLANFTVKILSGGQRSDTPCSQGRQGRWLLNSTLSEYQWSPYACGPSLVAPSDFAREIRRKGYRQITFIGDSHNRILFHHLKYLLGCPVRDIDEYRHTDNSDTAFIDDAERTLALRYFWVDG